MKNIFILTIVFLFVIISTQNIFAQTFPERMDIPSWIRMGMTVAQARENVPDNILMPRLDIPNQYIYFQDYRANDRDMHVLTITPENGLVSFQMGITFDVRNAVQILTQRYGEPDMENDESIGWLLRESNPINLTAISISIHNGNYNYLNLQYFFDDYFVRYSDSPKQKRHDIGQMLILGWQFVDIDTADQTNIAIDAIFGYIEAAKNQMSSELSSSLPRIELFKYNLAFNDIVYPLGAVFIYINSRSIHDYFDRYIEIRFYIVKNGIKELYNLVINYQNYNWLDNNDSMQYWTLIMEDEQAYNHFISELNSFRR